MARIYSRTHYSDYRAELAETKAMRQGTLEDAFWPEDELVDHRPKAKKSPRKRRGCPGNDGKAHVYIWLPHRAWWYDSTSIVRYEAQYCCGCEKRGKGFRRKTN